MADTLNYRVFGSSKPILWIHGYLETLDMWSNFPLGSLHERTHILLDLPGHGASVTQPVAPSIQAIATQIWDWYDQLFDTDPDIVGHSLGGYVLLEMHKQRPSDRKICLFHSNFWPDDPAKQHDRNRVIEVVKEHKLHYLREAIPNLFLQPEKHTEFIQTTLQDVEHMSSDAIATYAAAMRDRSGFESELAHWSHQLLVIQGALDRMVPLQRMLAYRNNIQLMVLENAGHMGHVEDREDAWALLENWLKING